MSKRSKFVYVISAFVLAGGLLVGGVALSEKAPAATSVAPGGKPLCENPAVTERLHKAVAATIETGHWTAKDREQILPLFHQLRTEQKGEILRKVAAAIEAKKLVVDKGVHL